ncbi:MAG: phage tail family protein [Kouleothrix sp.]|nr:phage tail family protein [Kouleothrix sp.]
MPTLSLVQGDGTYTLGGGAQPLLLDADGNPRAQIWLERDGDGGLGMPQLRRLAERGPSQHGASDRGFRLAPRTIDLVFGVAATTYSDLWDARQALLAMLTPTDDALALRWDLDNGQSRQIDVYFADGATMEGKDRRGYLQRVAVQFAAPDPTFYDPTPVAVTFGASGASSGMAVPLLIPWKFGASSITQARAIAYAGSWRSQPIITISGPIASPVITNQVDGAKLDFTGTTLTAGQTMTVDTRYGLKTVIDQAGANKISALATGSNLAFALLAHPQAPGGTNTIQVNGTGIGSATEVYMTFYTRYIGF